MPSFPGETLGGEILLGKVCHWGRALGQLEGWLSRVWPLVWVGSPLFWASGHEACWERERDVVFPPQVDGVAEDVLSFFHRQSRPLGRVVLFCPQEDF